MLILIKIVLKINKIYYKMLKLMKIKKMIKK